MRHLFKSVFHFCLPRFDRLLIWRLLSHERDQPGTLKVHRTILPAKKSKMIKTKYSRTAHLLIFHKIIKPVIKPRMFFQWEKIVMFLNDGFKFFIHAVLRGLRETILPWFKVIYLVLACCQLKYSSILACARGSLGYQWSATLCVLVKYLRMATDSMILTPLSSIAGTTWNGFTLANSSVLCSSLASRIDLKSNGMLAALQKM